MLGDHAGHNGVLAAGGAGAQMAAQRRLFGRCEPALVDQPLRTLMG
jgi:hypothetical protein